MIDQLLMLVRQLTISQRIGIVFGAALTVLMTVGLVMWAGQPQMQAAFTNVATSQAATITSALTSAGIPYELENGGATIAVPAALAIVGGRPSVDRSLGSDQRSFLP